MPTGLTRYTCYTPVLRGSLTGFVQTPEADLLPISASVSNGRQRVSLTTRASSSATPFVQPEIIFRASPSFTGVMTTSTGVIPDIDTSLGRFVRSWKAVVALERESHRLQQQFRCGRWEVPTTGHDSSDVPPTAPSDSSSSESSEGPPPLIESSVEEPTTAPDDSSSSESSEGPPPLVDSSDDEAMQRRRRLTRVDVRVVRGGA